MAMLEVGAGVWLPCEVKPGPFSDERMVLVSLGGNQWFGFVNTKWLREGIEQGADLVLAKVTEISGDSFTAIVPGNAPNPSVIQGRIDQWRPVGDSVETGHRASTG